MQYFVLKEHAVPSDWMRAQCCSVPTPDALGMVTADDVRCLADVPGYTCSLRDGWAVASDDNGKLRAPVAWSVENGQTEKRLPPGQAVWVNTGGVIPHGADAVIACRDALDASRVQEDVLPWQNIERQGCDWKAGEVILPAGTRVGAREMALLFEAGVRQVPGWAAPRAAVVATGSEMTDRMGGIAPGLRRCSNASYIAALLCRIGVTDVKSLVVPDDPEVLAGTLRSLDAGRDVIITVGGTGRGRRDYTRRAVLAAGGAFVGSDSEEDSPFVTARLSHAAMIGLPGNPLAVMMILQRVLLETVRNVFHLPETAARRVQARMTDPIEGGTPGDLCVALMKDENGWAARPVRKGTGRMRVFETAGGTVRLTGSPLERGQTVTAELFRN